MRIIKKISIAYSGLSGSLCKKLKTANSTILLTMFSAKYCTLTIFCMGIKFWLGTSSTSFSYHLYIQTKRLSFISLFSLEKITLTHVQKEPLCLSHTFAYLACVLLRIYGKTILFLFPDIKKSNSRYQDLPLLYNIKSVLDIKK